MVMAMLMLAGAGNEVHQMVTAMECAEWRRLTTAMKCVKWQQRWLRWIKAAGNSNGVRQTAMSNGYGNGVRQVAMAGSGNEVLQMATAMECVEW